MTLRTDVFLSTPALPDCLSGSLAPLISRSLVSLMLLPRYSVSCKLVEYSWRNRRRNFFQEKSEGSLSLDLSVVRTAENGRRNRRVRRYVVTRMAKIATTMMAIYEAVRGLATLVTCASSAQPAELGDIQLRSSWIVCSSSSRERLASLLARVAALCLGLPCAG